MLFETSKGGIKTKMKKLWKGKKALSPVVAAIILIAVTVAVSIAVAAWMGALTIGFMATEEASITQMTFGGTSGTANNTIAVVLKNTGTGAFTISTVKVNNVEKSVVSWSGDGTLNPADEETATIYMGTGSWANGNKYKVTMLSSTGKTIAAYEATAS